MISSSNRTPGPGQPPEPANSATSVSGKKRKRVCIACRQAHTACDGQLPCRRCIAAGRPNECFPSPQRKRGRPRLSSSSEAAREPATSPTGGLPSPAPPQEPSVPSSTLLQQSPQPIPVPQHYASTPARAALPTPAIIQDISLNPGLSINDSSIDDESVKPLLALVMDHLREVRQENAQLRHEVGQLRARVSDIDHLRHEVRQLRAHVERLTSWPGNGDGMHGGYTWRMMVAHSEAAGQPSKPSKPRSWYNDIIGERLDDKSSVKKLARFHAEPSGTMNSVEFKEAIKSTKPVPTQMLKYQDAIMRASSEERAFINSVLPFLGGYSNHLSTEPCIISDFANDIYAVLSMSNPRSPQELCCNKPRFTYASPAYCRLSGYDISELVGCTVDKVSRPEPEMLFIILVNYFLRNEKPIGNPFVVATPWERKDGIRVMVRMRTQVFYNPSGLPVWSVMRVDSVLDPRQQIPNDVIPTPFEIELYKDRYPTLFEWLFTPAAKTSTTTRTTITDETRSLRATFEVATNTTILPSPTLLHTPPTPFAPTGSITNSGGSLPSHSPLLSSSSPANQPFLPPSLIPEGDDDEKHEGEDRDAGDPFKDIIDFLRSVPFK